MKVQITPEAMQHLAAFLGELGVDVDNVVTVFIRAEDAALVADVNLKFRSVR